MSTNIIDIKAAELEAKIDTASLESSCDYKLSDAIREGSSVTGQCVGNWTDAAGNMCALSAALVAVKARHLI